MNVISSGSKGDKRKLIFLLVIKFTLLLQGMKRRKNPEDSRAGITIKKPKGGQPELQEKCNRPPIWDLFFTQLVQKQPLLQERSIYRPINPPSRSTLRIKMWLQISCMPRWRSISFQSITTSILHSLWWGGEVTARSLLVLNASTFLITLLKN